MRGGTSQSYLEPGAGNSASFYGMLDITSLGGAGFASQFSPEDGNKGGCRESEGDEHGESPGWDLTAFAGIEIAVLDSDHKVYTFILKDGSPPAKREDGRAPAGISWEAEFQTNAEGGVIWKPWKDFRATYRGKEVRSPGNLEIGQVKKVGIMMRR